MAFAGLLAAALLGEYFDRRAVAVVLAVTALPDLDAFVGLVSTVGHRTAGHTLVIPAVVAVLWAVDTRVREESLVRARWGEWGVAVGWMSILAVVVSGIGLDLVTGGVNPLWPIHDQLYRVTGRIELSSQRGIVQTFVDLSPEAPESGGGNAGPQRLGNSSEVFVSTGVDPTPGDEPEQVERIFPVVRSGWQLLLLVTGTAVTAGKLAIVERGDRQ
jgi:hypothetical protein